jgi:hypothetical protein
MLGGMSEMAEAISKLVWPAPPCFINSGTVGSVPRFTLSRQPRALIGSLRRRRFQKSLPKSLSKMGPKAVVVVRPAEALSTSLGI